MAYAPPANELEVWYARLPWEQSQRVFSGTSPVAGSATAATVAWHGTALSAERGAFAAARAGGPFDAWVGERVKITARRTRRAVYVYVNDLVDIDQDLSLPRRAFMALASLPHDELAATVERMK